jgi:type II secretion system protein E
MLPPAGLPPGRRVARASHYPLGKRAMIDILTKMIKEGLISAVDADRIRAAREEGTPLDDALFAVKGISEERLLRFLAAEFQLPYIDLESYHPPRELLTRFPARVLLEHHLLPLREENSAVLVATSRLSDATGLEEMQVLSGCECRPALAMAAEIDRHLKSSLGVGADTMQSLVSEFADELEVSDHESDDDLDLTEAAEDASIVRFMNQVLTEAISLRATDVHFEPFEDELQVRYRVDGILQAASIPIEVRRFQAAIISRLKILSRLDIAEKRLPQDGRIKLQIADREIDVRVSVIPMMHGEAAVLRLLDRSTALLGLEQLGMAIGDRNMFERVLALPHGIVLVTGPTGSGKTTTLYAALSRINDVGRKIVTIEDPVEYQLRGINQIQVNSKAGLTFARALRSILRHDPDVILVGEIRDRETAEIAVHASLTGHLVFSTLHTNDAAGALARLTDMGIEPYLVVSSLEAVVAQRLVRLICRNCRTEVPQHEVEQVRRQYGLEALESLWRGQGCRECRGTGYQGRTGVFEFMPLTDKIRSLILEGAATGLVHKVAQELGMRSLWEDGCRLLREGQTTIEEVLRVTKAEAMNGNGFGSEDYRQIASNGCRQEGSVS